MSLSKLEGNEEAIKLRVNVRARLLIILFLVAVAATTTLAQSGLILQPPPTISFEDWRLARLDDVSEEYEVSFPSAEQTSYLENNTVRLNVLLPVNRLGRIPAVILLHYWGAADTRLERDMALQLNRRGIGAVILELPYHLSRTPRGCSSGELAVQPDPDRLCQTMRQSLLDVRRTVDWIQTRREFSASPIGLSGTSLGAIVASLAYGTEPRITQVCFVLGGVDIAQMLWNSSRAVGQREVLRRNGFTEEKLRNDIAEIEPLRYLQGAPHRPALVIAARYDTVVPKDSTNKLIAALKDPTVVWLDTGHFGGFLAERQILRTVTEFLSSSFAGKEFAGPSQLRAPTIRMGLLADEPGGLQVTSGVDLWRYNNNRDAFVSALITPRGMRGFAGVQVSKSLSIGMSVSSKRGSWGVLWSFVL